MARHTENITIIQERPFCLLSPVLLSRLRPAGMRRILPENIMATVLVQEVTPEPLPTTVLLDSGATITCLGAEIIDYLALNEVERRKGRSAEGEVDIIIYEEVRFELPHKLGVFDIRVASMNAYYYGPTAYNLLLGMDILMRGQFIVNGHDATWTLIFPD